MKPVSGEERLARAGLTRLCEPGDRAVRRCVLAEGHVAAHERLRAERPDLPDAASDLRRIHALGGRFLCPGDDEWPTRLADLERASKTGPDGRAGEPYGLWVRGPARLATATQLSVAVVGSRSATAYGVSVAGRLAADLADRGWWIASGAAIGIDRAAHEAALDSERTVAVLANGVDVAYPPENAALLRRISRCGLVVSEVPCGVTPRRPRFLIRNRLLAALSLGVVVVEAGVRSGALNTARHAALLGRPLLGVPGPVTSGLSAGVHQLLRELPEARLVTRAPEIVEEVGRIGELADPCSGRAARATACPGHCWRCSTPSPPAGGPSWPRSRSRPVWTLPRYAPSLWPWSDMGSSRSRPEATGSRRWAALPPTTLPTPRPDLLGSRVGGWQGPERRQRGAAPDGRNPPCSQPKRRACNGSRRPDRCRRETDRSSATSRTGPAPHWRRRGRPTGGRRGFASR